MYSEFKERSAVHKFTHVEEALEIGAAPAFAHEPCAHRLKL